MFISYQHLNLWSTSPATNPVWCNIVHGRIHIVHPHVKLCLYLCKQIQANTKTVLCLCGHGPRGSWYKKESSISSDSVISVNQGAVFMLWEKRYENLILIRAQKRHICLFSCCISLVTSRGGSWEAGGLDRATVIYPKQWSFVWRYGSFRWQNMYGPHKCHKNKTVIKAFSSGEQRLKRYCWVTALSCSPHTAISSYSRHPYRKWQRSPIPHNRGWKPGRGGAWGMIDSPFECKDPMREGRAGWKHSDWIKRERRRVFAGDWRQFESATEEVTQQSRRLFGLSEVMRSRDRR